MNLRTAESGTHSPFTALQNSGSYQGFKCREFAATMPVNLDPQLPKQHWLRCFGAGGPHSLVVYDTGDPGYACWAQKAFAPNG